MESNNNSLSSHYDDENVMNLYLKSLYSTLENDTLTYFKDNQNFRVTSKRIGKRLVFTIRFLSTSDLNKTALDINFFLKISEKYPETEPILTCISNVNQLIYSFAILLYLTVEISSMQYYLSPGRLILRLST